MDWLYLNGILLFLPIIFIRYGILKMLSEDGLARARYEPFLEIRYIQSIYNLSLILMLITLFFYKIKYAQLHNQIGFGIFLFGLLFYLVATINFSKPNQAINTNGLYKISRNPMYVGFFICFIGIALILESFIVLILLLIYQISSHFVIKAEELWCIKSFNNHYLDYMKKVRRYL